MWEMPSVVPTKECSNEDHQLEPPVLRVSQHLELEPGCQRFRVSANHCYENPALSGEEERGSQRSGGPDSVFLEEVGRRLSLMQDLQLPSRPSFSRPDVADCSPSPYAQEVIEEDQNAHAYWMTLDALPRLEHYRQSQTLSPRANRPTVEQLRTPQQVPRRQSVQENSPSQPEDSAGVVKFGWIRGVYIRCLLNIWGVMLFLRMGWMVGQSGIGGSILIVLLATFNTVVTTISMAAICTNGEVRGGGAYYMISRSLGPEFGGVVGMVFFVANTISVSMYIVGAAETVRDLLLTYHAGIVEHPSSTNDVRVSGLILLALTACVTGVGMAFENKAQIFLLIALLVALMDYFVGACLKPTLLQTAKGFVGWDLELGVENWGPDYRDGEDFFSVFSIFFPSVIGILAGANISGDLKDPCSAIPKGTLLAIVSTSVSYIMIIVWLGLTVVRDATGEVEDVLNGTFRNCTNRHCPHGLLNYNQVMEMSSGFGPFIYVGIFAACLSSALASLVGAPRIFQALCRDKIFPVLSFFGKGYGINDDPHRAMALTLLIAVLFTVIGFRPGFKYFNKWLSLLCAAFCVAAMFIMSWVLALVTFVIVFALYLYILKTEPELNWGDSIQSQAFKTAMAALTRLESLGDHVKTFRPSVLAMTGNPGSRPPLVDFGNSITKRLGLLVCGQYMKSELPPSIRAAILEHNRAWLQRRKVKAFYTLCEASSLSEATASMLQLVGLGKVRPNILLLGFKSLWMESDLQDLDDYFNAIQNALDAGVAVAILRSDQGLDYSSYFESDYGIPFGNAPDGPDDIPQESSAPTPDDDLPDTESCETARSESPRRGSMGPATGFGAASAAALRRMSHVIPDVQARLARFRRLNSLETSRFRPRDVPPQVLAAADQFRTKRTEGYIDVWWLYDDGGLTLLLPYVLTTRAVWRRCKLRVFCIAPSHGALDQTQVNISTLLTKFRVDFSAVTVLPDINHPATQQSKQSFQELLGRWTSAQGGNLAVSRTELEAQEERTNRHLRLRELLELHSDKAELIVMTLPMPRRQSSAGLYMAWLETLTSGMPPLLLVRGNQTSVLTFYS